MGELRNDEISVEELHRRRTAGEEITVLDVREPLEYGICNIGGVLIPLGSLPHRLESLDPSQEIAVVCHHGNRSRIAVDFLRSRGFTHAKNVVGGVAAWADRVDPSMPRY